MNYQDEVLQQLKAQTALMQMISQQLRVNAPASPKYRRPLREYQSFDWSIIGAEPVTRDAQGISEVEWMGHRFTRRAGSGKFGKAIWFSRAIGQSEDGTEYALLIKFAGEGNDAEPIPTDVLK
ncbi:MAG: hypothetical protein BroJett011_04150 [Chloroflexota bacterium]|nr:MAG: hypothetical protein BroJett011_04150 [Chloroflexota bacterium]